MVRECPYCGRDVSYIRRHIAASPKCRDRYARRGQAIGQAAAQHQGQYYELPDNSPRPPIPVPGEIPPLGSNQYDNGRDFLVIARLQQLGILPQGAEGFQIAPRLQAAEIPSVQPLPLRADIDIALQDFGPQGSDIESDDEDDFGRAPQQAIRAIAAPPPPDHNPPPRDRSPTDHISDDLYSQNIYSLPFNDSRAGKPILTTGNKPKKCGDAYEQWEKNWKDKETDSPFRPFRNLMEWEICQWAKLTGPSKFSADWLFGIDTVSFII